MTRRIICSLLLSLSLAPVLLGQDKQTLDAAGGFVASGQSLSDSARRRPLPARWRDDRAESAATRGLAQALNKMSIEGNLSVGRNFSGTAAPADGMIVQGNVGIGTSTPTATLHVNGVSVIAPDSNREISLGTPNSEAGMAIKNSGNRGDVRFDGARLKLVAGPGVGPPSSLNGINIDFLGKVGIGRESISNKLEVEASGSTAAVYGFSPNGIGLLGLSTNNVAVYGSSSLYAGLFDGNVVINGSLSKSSGSFKIDHPLDPENKYLYHSFVEAPDMMNIYNGLVTLDDQGEAAVSLPEWFGALNRDFRYQLTCVGGFAPIYIAEKIKNNRFKIAGGKPGLEVSWQVTGIRQDAYANKNRIKVEEDKPERERGHYLHPELFNQPEEKGVEWARYPEMMRQRKEEREKSQKDKANQPNP